MTNVVDAVAGDVIHFCAARVMGSSQRPVPHALGAGRAGFSSGPATAPLSWHPTMNHYYMGIDKRALSVNCGEPPQC